jgi:hypothetical protein
MKYTIQNNGHGLVMIKVFVAESMVESFLHWIDQRTRQNPLNKTRVIRPPSPPPDEEKLKQGRLMYAKAESFYYASISDGLPKNQAISTTLQKMKGAGYYDIRYQALKTILARCGCFRAKKPVISVN